MQNHTLKRTALACAVASIVGLAEVTHAQDEGAGATSSRGNLDEVVVTARRRLESLQDVPIAVSAITGEQADIFRIEDTQDLAMTVPNLDFSKQGGFAYIPFLRGVGTSSAAAGAESPIAIYVDDVYIASPNAKLFSLANIENVQVLKGPQGTLFGRNATGGVIQIQTKQPRLDEVSGRVSVGLGDYDSFEGSAYGNIPLGDRVAFNIAAAGRGQDEGYGKSVVTGRETQRTKDWNVRAQLLFQVSDATSIKFSASYSDLWTDEGWNQNVLPGQATLFGDTYVGEFNTNTDGTDYSSIQQTGFALHIDHEFSFADFVSITSYQDTQMETDLDQDGGQIEFFNLLLDSPTETLSQEFRLASNSEGALQWVTGFFYMNMEAQYDPACLCGMLAGIPAPFPDSDPAGGLVFWNTQDLDSYSVFAEGTYSFTENTSLTLGVRYTEDSFDYKQEGFVAYFGDLELGAAPGTFYSQDESFDEVTYRIILDHQFTDEIMGYISQSRGFKSGGYNLTEPGSVSPLAPIIGLPPPTGVVEPEVLDATEIGVKTMLFDGTLTFNAAAFYYDYENIIVTITTGSTLSSVNGPEAEMIGLDADFVFQPNENWRIAGGIGYLDTEYTDFPEGPIFIPLPMGGNATGTADLTGNETQRAPEFTFSLSPSYTFRAGQGDMILAAHYYYNSGWYSDAENRLEQPSYDVVNASWTYALDSGWGVRVWGANLTDERYYSFIQGAEINDNNSLAPPRTYGFNVWKEF